MKREKSSAYVEINQIGTEYLTTQTDQIFSDTVTCMSLEKKKQMAAPLLHDFITAHFFLLHLKTDSTLLKTCRKDDGYNYVVSHNLIPMINFF